MESGSSQVSVRSIASAYVSRLFYNEACHVIDDFIETFVSKLTKAERPQFLFNDQDPIRVGKRSIPKTISTYSEHLKDFVLEIDDATGKSLLFPPSRRIRSQCLHKEVTQTTSGSTASHALDLTSTGSTSSATSMGSTMTDFEAKSQKAMDQLTPLKDKIESNQTTLQQQTVASGERMKKLEDSVIKSFESINSLANTQTSLQQSMTETNERLTVFYSSHDNDHEQRNWYGEYATLSHAQDSSQERHTGGA
jgi:hypothetical protein